MDKYLPHTAACTEANDRSAREVCICRKRGAMPKPEHTPGPWTTDPDGDGAIVDQRGWCMARVNLDIFDCGANARLIAAAPDLLAALEQVASLPGFEPNEPYAQSVLAAIRKAKGEG